MLFSSIFVVIHFISFSDVEITKLPTGLYGYGITIAIFSTVLPTFMVMEGIKLFGASLGSIIGSIGSVLRWF